MKAKLVLLFIVMIICECIFSQTKEVEYDYLEKKPYEFIVNKTKFRLRVNPKEDYTLMLEKYTTKWEVVSNSIQCDNRILFQDVNNDGYIDFGSSAKWDVETWLYNPIKNIYINSGFFSKNEFDNDEDHMKLIDEKANIYFDIMYYKRGEVFSELFQIKEYKKIKLGIIRNETKYSEQSGDFITTAILISRFVNNIDEKLLQKIKWTKSEEFDYATYWKNNWKNFLK